MLFWSSLSLILCCSSAGLAVVLPKTVQVLEKRNNCGPGIGTCANNMCCSQWGYCGTTDDYCGAGCQSAFGRCNVPIDTRQCGNRIGNCPAGLCCSKWGYCGITADFCAPDQGCQVQYGKCNPPIPNPGGMCGQGIGPCPAGLCCSEWGYCGTTQAYCGKGCQNGFGQCNPGPPFPSPDGSCGPGSLGPYTCAGAGLGKCCSQWGWCGDTDGHCGGGCQLAFGRCN